MEWYFILVIIALVYVAYLIFTSMTHFLFKVALIIGIIIFLLYGLGSIRDALYDSIEVAPVEPLKQVDEPVVTVTSNETVVPLNITNSSG